MGNGLSAREAYGSVRVEGKNPKSVCWNDEVKSAVRRKEVTWKEVLAANDEVAKERCMKAYRGEKRKVRRYEYIRAKRKLVNSLKGR